MAIRSSPQALDAQLCFALYRAERAMTRAYAQILEPLKLTYPQYLAMLALWEADGISVRELGERLGLDSATLTPLLSRLEARQLVTKARDAQDGRVVRVSLTLEGKKMKAEARSVPTALACRAGYDPRDAAALRRLEKLREELNGLTEQLEAEGAAEGAGPVTLVTRRS